MNSNYKNQQHIISSQSSFSTTATTISNIKNKTRNNEWYKNQVITKSIQPILPTNIENETNDKAVIILRTMMREAMNFNSYDRPSAINILHRLKHYDA